MLESDAHDHGERDGKEHANGSPEPPPEDEGDDHHEGGEAEAAAHDLGLDHVPQAHVHGQVPQRGEAGAAGADLEQGEEDGGGGGDERSDVGHVVEQERHHSPEEGEVDPDDPEPERHERARGQADGRLDGEVPLNVVDGPAVPAQVRVPGPEDVPQPDGELGRLEEHEHHVDGHHRRVREEAGGAPDHAADQLHEPVRLAEHGGVDIVGDGDAPPLEAAQDGVLEGLEPVHVQGEGGPDLAERGGPHEPDEPEEPEGQEHHQQHGQGLGAPEPAQRLEHGQADDGQEQGQDQGDQEGSRRPEPGDDDDHRRQGEQVPGYGGLALNGHDRSAAGGVGGPYPRPPGRDPAPRR